jgi:hypothetical protein
MRFVEFIMVFCAIFGLILAWLNRRDRLAYNRGRCRQCGEKLEKFDTDSQGGRGYQCKNGHTLWVSYDIE